MSIGKRSGVYRARELVAFEDVCLVAWSPMVPVVCGMRVARRRHAAYRPVVQRGESDIYVLH
jgi:hypothetical protein